MEKKQLNPGTLVGPVPPILVSCGTMEKPNLLTIAWTGIVNSNPPMTYISVRPERYSHPIIDEAGEFVINLATADQVKQVDYCGVATGAKVNKFQEGHFTPVPTNGVSCPAVAECPIHFSCKVVQKIPLGSHTMFMAEIVGVAVDEEFIDKDGKLHMDKMNLLAYLHGEYFCLGKRLGSFGFSVRKKPLKEKAVKEKKKRQGK